MLQENAATEIFSLFIIYHWISPLPVSDPVMANSSDLDLPHQIKTLPKAQRTRGLSSAHQSNFFRSYHKFSTKSWLDLIFIISTKQQLQNISQISAFWLILNFKILAKRSLRISTKNNLHNLQPRISSNFSLKILPENFKILTKPCARSLDKKLFYGQTSAAESAPNHRQHISKLNISNSSNLNKF